MTYQALGRGDSPTQFPRGAIPAPAFVGAPAALFPTNGLKWGDVVSVTGSFQALAQGQVRVKFAGAPWQAPALRGPYSAAVIVPKGAETGECLIEVNGRVVFGRQCSVVQERFAGAKPQESRDYPSWHNFGEKSHMGSYVHTNESRGVGAISALTTRVGAPAGEGELIVRTRMGEPGSALSINRSGVALPNPQTSAMLRAMIPRRPTMTGSGPRKTVINIYAAPRPTLPAGVIPGISTALDYAGAADAASADDELEEIAVTEVPLAPSNTKWWLLAAAAVGAYLVLR